MGGELGNKTYIDDLLESSACECPPNFTLIDRIFYFCTDLFILKVGKVGAFELSRISRRDRVGKNKASKCFICFVFWHVQCGVSGSGSNFQVLIRKSGGGRAF